MLIIVSLYLKNRIQMLCHYSQSLRSYDFFREWKKRTQKDWKIKFSLFTFHDSFTNYYKYFKRGLKSPNYFLNLSDACCMDPLSLLQFFSEILVFTLLHLLRFHDEATNYKANRFPAFIFRQGCKPRLLASLMRVYVIQHLLKVTWHVNCPFWDSLLCIVHYPKWYLMRKENAWNVDIRESGVSSLYMNSHIKKKIFVYWYQNDLYWAHIIVLPKLSDILRNEISSIAIVV